MSSATSVSCGGDVPTTMRAVVLDNGFGGPEMMSVGTAPTPAVTETDVLIRVHASAVNRADTLQRKGGYKAPPGASEILGLECAGEIAVADAAGTWKIGDRVMCLLTGGGYADYAAVPASLCIPVPEKFTFSQAAALPEVWLTATQLLHTIGKVQKGDYVLIHAGASGVGTAAIQLVLRAGGFPIVTVGSAAKVTFTTEFGAVAAFNYKTQSDWGKLVKEATPDGRGVNLILDCVGASHSANNFEAIAADGRWVLYGLMGGGSVDTYPIAQILRKRIQLTGTTLRARSVPYKVQLIKDFVRVALDGFNDGTLKPVVDSVLPMDKIVDAHVRVESNATTGKVVIVMLKEDEE